MKIEGIMKTLAKFLCPCPNCGGKGVRTYFTSNDKTYQRCLSDRVIQTECLDCDYLMVMCARNGIVIEAYAPGAESPTNNLKLPPSSEGENKPTVFC